MAFPTEATARFDWDQESARKHIECGIRACIANHKTTLKTVGRKPRPAGRRCNAVWAVRAGFEPRVDRSFPVNSPDRARPENKYNWPIRNGSNPARRTEKDRNVFRRAQVFALPPIG